MNILLIAPQFEYEKPLPQYITTIPNGLSYISAMLKNKTKHHVDCLNLNLCHGTVIENINHELSEKQYDIVGTGFICTGYRQVEEIIQTIRAHPTNPLVILGGLLISSEPYIVFDSLNPDFGVIGEGEETIVELVNEIEKRTQDFNHINGIIYNDKKGSTIITNVRKPIQDLNTLPFPDYESFGLDIFLDHILPSNNITYNIFDYPRVYYVFASRSCPHHCTFCYHDSNYRQRSIDNIFKELEERVQKYHINIVYISDELFSIDKNRVAEFCERMKLFRKTLPYDLRFLAQMRVDSVDNDTLRMMKDSGFYMCSYGFESYNSTVLQSMKKRTSPKLIQDCFHNTLNNGLCVSGNFIFGDPSETWKTAMDTLDFFENEAQGQLNLSFITPYPNSEIYQHCLNKDIIKDKLDFIKNCGDLNSYVYNLNFSSMNDNEFADLHVLTKIKYIKCRKGTIPQNMKRDSDTGRFSFSVRCPYCHDINSYKNYEFSNFSGHYTETICKSCGHYFSVRNLKGYMFYWLLNYIPGFEKMIFLYKRKAERKYYEKQMYYI
jgi:anaerobic magnesium-protoporphyrin IX monomethyl ester cyclase